MREFRISFKSHKPVSKTYRPKNDNFCLFMTLRFPFWYLYTSNAFIAWWILHFRGKNCPKMCLKINRSLQVMGCCMTTLTLIGGVTHWGGLSGLKCWNGDNLFDWIDFLKINTYCLFFWRKTELKKKNANFFPLWRVLISVNQNAECEERAGKRKRTNLIGPFFIYW